MNEAITGSRLHYPKEGDFHQHASIHDEDSDDHKPLSFRSVHATESTHTGTTRSISDVSGIKSMIVVDHRQRNHASGMKWPFKKSALSPSPTGSKESNYEQTALHPRRHSAGRRKIGRKLLAGMIAKVMMTTVGDNHTLDGTEKEISGECDSSLCKVEESHSTPRCQSKQQGGAVLPATPPFCDNDGTDFRSNKKKASSSDPTNMCKASSESCDGSVITEEVIFEEDLPTQPVFDDHHEVASVGSKKSLIRASSDTTADDMKGDASLKIHLPQRSASARDFSLDAQRDLVPRLPPRQRSFEKLVSPMGKDKQEPPGEVRVAPVAADSLCAARRTTTHSTSTRSSCTSSGTILSGEQIHAYVMSHMPEFVQKQLPEDEWRRIFSAAAAVQEAPLTLAVTVSGSVDHGQDSSQTGDKQRKEVSLADDDLSSAVSCLTIPFSVGEFKEESDAAPRRASEVSAARSLTKRHAAKSRSWHEGSSTHESAPRLPTRCGQKVESDTQLRDARAFPKQARALEPSSYRAPKRNVVFAKVYVRYYERILDVNPSTRSGPSVGIGWKYKDMVPIEMDCVKDKITEYHNLVLSRPEREKMLYDLGYSRGDLAKAVRLNLKLKNQRAQTYNNLRHEKVEYLVEKSKRKVGQLLRSFGAGKKD